MYWQRHFRKPCRLSGWKRPALAALRDLNLDGDLDLAVANDLDDTVTVLLGGGGGHSQRADLHYRKVPQSLFVVDMNATASSTCSPRTPVATIRSAATWAATSVHSFRDGRLRARRTTGCHRGFDAICRDRCDFNAEAAPISPPPTGTAHPPPTAGAGRRPLVNPRGRRRQTPAAASRYRIYRVGSAGPSVPALRRGVDTDVRQAPATRTV